MDVELYGRALDRARIPFAGLQAEHMDRPTPCAEWNVRDLAAHLVGGNLMFASAARREPPAADSGGDVLGDDPAAAFDSAAEASRAAWSAPGALEGTVSLPVGDLPAEMALSIAFLDNLVHCWDLAVATGQDATLDPELATIGLDIARMLAPGGRGTYFGAEVTVAADAPPDQRLVALLGRQP